MTVAVETPISTVIANGVATLFTFTFTIDVADDLKVQFNGVDAAIGSYVVTTIGSGSGSITTTAVLTSGTVVTMYRNVVLKRETDYQQNGDFFAKTANADFDRIYRAMQDLGGVNNVRALRGKLGEVLNDLPAAADRAGHILGFDGNGQPVGTLPVNGSANALALDLLATDLVKGARLINYGSGTLGDRLLNMVPAVVSSVAELRLLPKGFNTKAITAGYYVPGDNGGNTFYLDAADTTSADNGGTIIVAVDGARWKAATQNVINFRQFGAKGDGSTDDTAALRLAFKAWAALANVNAQARLVGPAGRYNVTSGIDVSSYFSATSYYNLTVDLDHGCVFNFTSALNPGIKFGPPDGGAFAFGNFNLGGYNANGFAATCLYVCNIVDSTINIGSIGGYAGGIGVNFRTTGAAGGVLNNTIFIEALLGGLYGVLIQDAGVSAHAFQGNRLRIGHCTSHTGSGIWLLGQSSSNTIEVNSLEANAGGVLDQAGYNIWRLNFANGNSFNIGSANGRVDIEGYQISMTNSANAIGHVKDNSVSCAPQKPAVPASGALYQNAFLRPATMTISGGTVSNIVIDGVSMGITAGSFSVPYGSVVQLTYSAAPSWVWTFR